MSTSEHAPGEPATDLVSSEHVPAVLPGAGRSAETGPAAGAGAAGASVPVKAYLLYVGAMLLFPASDALAKLLGGRYHVIEIAWMRFVVHFALIAGAIAVSRRVVRLRWNRPALNLLRGVVMALTTVSMFAALQYMPLATVVAILFAAPVIVAALSAPLLRERMDAARWIAVLVGFAGVVVVFRPTLFDPGPGLVFAVTAALCSAIYHLVSRPLSRTEHPLTGLLYVTVVGMAGLGIFVPGVWVPPAAGDLALMAAMGVIATVGYLGVFKAIEYAPPGRLAPFFYLQIVSASALGFVIFDEVPDRWTIIGTVMIIGAGLIALRRAPGAARLPAKA